MKTKAIIASLIAAASMSHAATFTVTNLADYNPLGDPPVLNSLRQVIAAASAIPNEFHTINFAPGLKGAIQLQDELSINFSGEINGPGAGRVAIVPAINRHGISINFGSDPSSPGFFKLTGLTIRDGDSTTSAPFHYSCLTARNLILVIEDCSFENNRMGSGDLLRLEMTTPSSLIKNSSFISNQARSCIFLDDDCFLTVLNSSYHRNRILNTLHFLRPHATLDFIHNTCTENTATNNKAVDTWGVIAEGFSHSGWAVRAHRNIFHRNIGVLGSELSFRNVANVIDSENLEADPHMQRLARWHGSPYLIPRPDGPACPSGLATFAMANPLHPDFANLILDDARGHLRPATGVHYGAAQVFSESVPLAADPFAAGAELVQTITALQNTPDPIDFILLPAGHYDIEQSLPAMATPVVFLGPPIAPGQFPLATISGNNEYSLLACSSDGQGTGKEFGADGLHLMSGGNPAHPNGAGGFSTYDNARNFLRSTVFEACSVSGGASAGAISIIGGSTRIERCVVHQNVGLFSRPGGMKINPSFPETPAHVEIIDSIFTANTTDDGSAAAIDVFGSHLTLTHCTIRENTVQLGATPIGAGVSLAGGSSTLRLENTVINGNLRNGIPDDLVNAGTTTPVSSMVSNPFATFTGLGFGPLTLPAMPSAGSHVINAASPAIATESDFLGSPRNAFGLPDVGAIEYFSSHIERDHARIFRDAPCDPVARMDMMGLDRDPDGDGFPTWLELISGTDPFTPGATPLTHHLNTAQNRFEITVPDYSEEIAAHYGINWVPNRSLNLVDWLGSDGYFEIIDPVPGKPGHSSRTVYFPNIDPATSPRQFFRLELASGSRQPFPCVVGIGEPNGNAGDPDNGFGVVNYPLAIGKYEVTNAEYAAFLRSVDPEGENQLGLFVEDMELDPRGGIVQVGKSYQPKAGRESHPVNFITYDSARRYCNWLHNGAFGAADTESGAYDMAADGPRATDARWFLPTFDEFYKAAYFITSTNPNPPFQPLYQDYPTGSTINTDFPGDAQSANINGDDTRPVGSYAAPSIWGAYDMAGNVGEILESPNSTHMNTKGGTYADDTFGAAFRNGIDTQFKGTPTAFTGFRVATRPAAP